MPLIQIPSLSRDSKMVSLLFQYIEQLLSFVTASSKKRVEDDEDMQQLAAWAS